MIDRKTYLEMCQKVSVLESGAFGIKKNVPKELLVIYDNTEYYPEKYVLSFDNGEAIHTAVLHDLRANMRMCADLEKTSLLHG